MIKGKISLGIPSRMNEPNMKTTAKQVDTKKVCLSVVVVKRWKLSVCVGVVVLLISFSFLLILGLLQKSYVSTYKGKCLIDVDERIKPADNVLIPVDIVVTWVDSSDEIWRKEHERESETIFGHVKMDKARYPHPAHSEHELNVSIRSIFRFLPWIRKIYIVTHRPQRPTFLEKMSVAERNKIELVHIFVSNAGINNSTSHWILKGTNCTVKDPGIYSLASVQIHQLS